MPLKDIFFTTLILCGTAAAAQADTLVIQAVDQTASIARPDRGQSMASVESQFGKPESISPTVGQPPITRWVYPGFTVYFEDQTVIRAVANREPKAP
ncbi:MAG: hypothetical protein KKA36_02405 [Gammaproteobacteria bacterium]|nr:hypothetical protein [Gammaproteobacteria bacterium]MBU2477915.1 hypothetical protein [Gammaproteobacteria bacterium]